MEIDNYYILCPYCKKKNGDLIEYNEGETYDFTCEHCSMKFTGRKVVTIDFRTEGNCNLNGEEHNFERYKCKNCDQYI